MQVKYILRDALQDIVEKLGFIWPEKVTIEPPRQGKHGGDLAVNIAMVLSAQAGKAPRVLAESIAEHLRASTLPIADVSIAGPGFLNITFSPELWHNALIHMEESAAHFGSTKHGAGKKVQVEFVSANPTGPLHIGHGRGAAVGDSLARILRYAGYDVQTEYYINDAGRQMRLLGYSVWLRAKELCAPPVIFPDEYYKGSYIIDIARDMLDKGLLTEDMLRTQEPDDKAQDICYDYGMNAILDGIKADLARFRVLHDNWFSEKSLVERDAVTQAFARLREAGLSFEQDGALWFQTTAQGDDKDRVLQKSDGSLTYFASDIAYHHDKYQRGFDRVIDVWGADHHGYIARMRAAVHALGREQSDFDVVLIQLVNLLENGKNMSMSTRAGTFETLADVVQEVGVDAARFMFLSRKSDSPLDFDLELVKQRSMDNPVYYVQYAHARLCAVLRRAEQREIHCDSVTKLEHLHILTQDDDIALIRMAARFPEVAASAAEHLSAHIVSNYLSEFAGALHSYYAKNTVIQEDDMPLTKARLRLLRAIRHVFANGLELLGVSAPDTM